MGLRFHLLGVLRRLHCIRHVSSTTRKMDYYKVLEVSPQSSQTEIRAAYVRLCQLHHPDKGGRKEDFALLQQAYQVLSKPSARLEYDEAWRYTLRKHATAKKSSPFYYDEWSPEKDYTRGASNSSGTFTRRPSSDPFHHFAKGGNQNRDDDYYGTKYAHQVHNGLVIAFCVILIVMGSAMQFLSLRMRNHIDAQSAQAAAHCRKLEEDSEGLDRNEILRRIFEDVTETTSTDHVDDVVSNDAAAAEEAFGCKI